jgi:hypothetical protein
MKENDIRAFWLSCRYELENEITFWGNERKMSDQQIRDKNNKLMATIKTASSGKQEIRDPSNRLLGTFDPKSNETRDPNNRLVAKGNVLASLIRAF